MRKTVYLFFILSFVINAGELNLEKVIERYLKHSVNVKILNTEKEKIKIEKEAFKNAKKREVAYKFTAVENGANYSGNDYVEETLSLELSYKDFFIAREFNALKDEMFNWDYKAKDSNQVNIGYRKTLTDLFYKNDKIEEFNLDKKELKIEEGIKNEKLKAVEDIIKKYTAILNTKLEIELNESIEVEYLQMTKSLKAALAEGEIIKIELEISELELAKLKEKIVYLRKQIEIQKKELLRIANFDQEIDYTFKKFELKELKEVYINNYELLSLELEKDVLKETLLFTKKQLFANISTEFSYDTLNESFNFSFQIAGNMFDYKKQEKLLEKDIKNIEYKILKVKEDIELKKEKKILNYNKLKRVKREAELEMAIKKKKRKLSERMFKEGYTNLKELINSKNEYTKSRLEYEIASNNLNDFILRQEIYNTAILQ